MSYKELTGAIFSNNSLAKESRPQSRQQNQNQNQNQNHAHQHAEGSNFAYLEQEE